MTDGFEVDRGQSGKIKINVISVANLIAMLTLLGTALATWNGLTSKVDIISARLDFATQSAAQIRADLNTTILARETAARELTGKVETIGNRLTAVETVLQRIERNTTK